MEDIQKITIKTEDGKEAEASVITFLKDDKTKKEYVLYTFDLHNENMSNARIYASQFVENSLGYELLPIESEEEWKALQQEIVKLTQD